MNREEKSFGDSMDRRDFMRRLAAGSAAAAGAVAVGFSLRGEGLPLIENTVSKGGEVGPRETVQTAVDAPLVVVRGEDPQALVRLALTRLGGMDKVVAPGDRVLIKPNIGWDRRPKFAANTNPEVVAQTARLCLEAGAKKVVVTDSPCNNPVRCFDRSGLKEALEGTEAELLIPTDRDYVEIDLKGEVLRTWPVLRAVLESDKIINVPIAKHHSSAVLSLGMKNWYGILGGGKKRGQLHQAMALAIAELAAFVKPDLTLLDAYRILFRNGPQGGSINDTKLTKILVVSRDPVVVDAFGATLFDLAPQEVPFIPLAAEKGLGRSDPGSVEIIEAGG